MNLRASFGSVKLTVKIRAFEVQSFEVERRINKRFYVFMFGHERAPILYQNVI